MLNELSFKIYGAYLKAKSKFEKFCEEEAGMETMEVVILVAVAVIIAGLLIEVLTKNFSGNNQGLIGYIFDKIRQRVDDLFSGNTTGTGP